MNKKLIKVIGSIILLMIVIIFGVYNLKPITESERTDTEKGGSVSGLQVYESKLGFSFQYPPYLFVGEDNEALIPERLYILPISRNNDDIYGIIISVSENDEGITPLEWLSGSKSGADLSKGYKILDIDGQEAVVIDDGTWVVVNTTDNKYRLSIALLPGRNETLLLTEMGIIIDSLRFDR